MVKRILLLGLAVVALAIALPAIVAQSGLGGDVAQAQTPPTTDPDDQADPPEAPDQADPPEAPDQADPPEAPDQADPPDVPDTPDTPDTPDQGDTPGADDEGSGDDDDEDEEQSPARPAPKTGTSGGGESGGSGSGGNAQHAPQTPLVRVSATPVSGVDTGTIPQGGIQAGAGGTADEGSSSARCCLARLR